MREDLKQHIGNGAFFHSGKRYIGLYFDSGQNPFFRLHDLCYFGITFLMKKGEYIRIIQELLYHNNLQTTKVYAHIESNAGKRKTRIEGILLVNKELNNNDNV